ncbi:MAG: oligosaccharide flippase family protein [Chloroflexi bacterium]|nr:oligosaccharide flippase family protein [Chloroflexota bacterium]
MQRIVRWWPVAWLIVIAGVLFWPALIGVGVLLPIDALFLYLPWRPFAAQLGVDTVNNHLIADTILQNYGWKWLAGEAYRAGQLPLWNPYILSGQPFLAAGQNGSLYPPGALYFLLGEGRAYGPFIWLHLALAGALTYWLARTLGACRWGALVAGTAFSLSSYLVVSVLWPMVVSTAVWLPGVLTVEERLIRLASTPEEPRHRVRQSLPWLALGAVFIALQFLAGHLEMSLYLLATGGMYAGLRLLGLLTGRRASGGRTWPQAIFAGLALLMMVGVGALTASAQLVPFAEAISANVRAGQVSYDDVRSYALPRQYALNWLLPNVFGNPSHHLVFDIYTGAVRAVDHAVEPRPGASETRTHTEWGEKNYVEGASYVGVLTLLLAAVALAIRRDGPSWSLAAIGLVSVLLAFGTPLYALLFFGVPGVSQLHTPFRWVYPLSLSLAVLGGLGASSLWDRAGRVHHVRPTLESGDEGVGGGVHRAPDDEGVVAGARATSLGTASLDRTHWWRARPRSWLWLAPGAICVLLSAAAWLARDSLLGLASRLLSRSSSAGLAFADPAMFVSYEWAGFTWFALLLLASGAVLLGLSRRWRIAAISAPLLLAADLAVAGWGFNTISDPALLRFVPPSVQAVQRDSGLFRIATFGPEELLPANTGMLFGLQDIRGYDTIVRRDYARYLEAIEPQTGLLYSKFDKLFRLSSLNSRLLDLLNVRYLLTTETVPFQQWRLVYDGEVRVYENTRSLPRAFVVGSAVAATDLDDALRQLSTPSFDPARTVVLEGLSGDLPPPSSIAEPSIPPDSDVAVVEYGVNRVELRVPAGAGGYLVLADLDAPGWAVRVDGQEQPLLRADGIFRAVALHRSNVPRSVVFSYAPLSFRAGALLSLLGALAIAFVGAFWLWPRLAVRPGSGPLGRVVKNSLFPMATSLLNKGFDLGFALILFRVLGPAGVGAYTFAVAVVGYLDILVNFGLGTLLTRDAVRHPEGAGRFAGTILVMRLALWLGAVALATAIVWPLATTLSVDESVRWAILLLTAGQLPSGLANAASALFQARERFEVPALVTILTSAWKITFGLLALIAGWGIVGLAAVSLAGNLVTALVLWLLVAVLLGWPRLSPQLSALPETFRQSYPLMLNLLLNSLFFRVDAVLLKPLAGDLALGWYSTAYRFVDGLQVIPSSLVLALFPMMARQAVGERAGLIRSFSTGLRALLAIAFPVAAGTTLLATPLIDAFAGSDYLPHSAVALSVLIWYLPLSFTNGIAQYALISIGRQRWITVSFVIAASFNLVANLLLIPAFGYLAAAMVTVASEVVLLVPFWIGVRELLSARALVALAWRPALAAAVMAGVVLWVRAFNPWLAIPLGALAYLTVLLAIGFVTPEERRIVLGRGGDRSATAVSAASGEGR